MTANENCVESFPPLHSQRHEVLRIEAPKITHTKPLLNMEILVNEIATELNGGIIMARKICLLNNTRQRIFVVGQETLGTSHDFLKDFVYFNICGIILRSLTAMLGIKDSDRSQVAWSRNVSFTNLISLVKRGL